MADALRKTDRALIAYWLGPMEWPLVMALQQRLVYEVSGGGTPALLLFEHRPGISVGSDGSARHIRLSPQELKARRWDVNWVSRGGGTWLHTAGQVACYPILPLGERTAAQYTAELTDIFVTLARSFGLPASLCGPNPGVQIRGRRVASVGAAIRSGVTLFGGVVYAAPDLELYRDIDCDGDVPPMTSLQRESLTPVRIPTVRQRLTELLADRFGYTRLTVTHTHPTFLPQPTRHATAPACRYPR